MNQNTKPKTERKPFYPRNPAEELASIFQAIYRRDMAKQAREKAEREQAEAQKKATAG